MLIAGRFLWGHRTAKSSEDVHPEHMVDGTEKRLEIPSLDRSWIRTLLSRKDRGQWVPALSGVIKAGDEGMYSSALFDGLHAYPGEITLEMVYEAFAHELRSRPMTERSAYPPAISRFVATTQSRIKRTQSVRVNKQSRQSMSPRRHSIDLLEKGLNRSKSRKTSPVLISTFNPLPSVDASTGHSPPSSWTHSLQHAQDLDGRVGINVTPQELSSLSTILGISPTKQPKGGEDVPAFDSIGAFGISISGEPTAKGKRRISLKQHKRRVTQLPGRGSGYSALLANHLASGSLPFSQDEHNINSIHLTNNILEPLKAGENLHLQQSPTQTRALKYLSTLPSSRHIKPHNLTPSQASTSTNLLLHSIATLPFVGGLVPLATPPLIEAVRFVASTGLPPARLLQRLEALVDKVHNQAPHLRLFGPLFEPQNAGLLFRERERLGKLATGVSVEDTIADKMARMRRYSTLVERLMAVVPGVKQEDVLREVREATMREIEWSYKEAVAAFKNPGTISPIVPTGVVAKRYSSLSSRTRRSKRSSTSSILEHSQSAPASTTQGLQEKDTVIASPRPSSTFPILNLGQQVERLLKAELPFDVQSVAVVVRLVLVAWTLSVERVEWDEENAGGEV
ncbi:hypothetical protein P154DRAFT_389257, partial [Amniculicola lignicola CBS 123094]